MRDSSLIFGVGWCRRAYFKEEQPTGRPQKLYNSLNSIGFEAWPGLAFENIPNPIPMLKILYFLPFLVYLFFNSNSLLIHWLFITFTIILIALGCYEFIKGILSKDKSKIPDGFLKVYFGISGLLASIILLSSLWLFILLLVGVGISMLIEKLLIRKVESRSGF